jgi:hypothetical protein
MRYFVAMKFVVKGRAADFGHILLSWCVLACLSACLPACLPACF